MIRRCAKHQPHADSYGTAARNGARALAYTSWGIGDFQSDHARASGVPDVLYPAMKLLDDAPIVMPSNEPVRDHIQEYLPEFSAVRWREEWERITQIFGLPQSVINSWPPATPPARPRSGEFRVSISRQDLMARIYPLSLDDVFKLHARSLPPEVRPPDNAQFTVREAYDDPNTTVTTFWVDWRET